MKPITKSAWALVHEKACDIVNASSNEDDVMTAVHTGHLMEILDDLVREDGPHAVFYDTRADFLDDPNERRRLYRRALELAREQQNEEVAAEVIESMAQLQNETE